MNYFIENSVFLIQFNCVQMVFHDIKHINCVESNYEMNFLRFYVIAQLIKSEFLYFRLVVVCIEVELRIKYQRENF